MLEGLVSSKIRRALLTHLLAHPDERVYLRGLAKTLHLSLSPLRRELKRLEHAGLLRAVQEGNILFYFVDHACPGYQQLKSLSAPPRASQPHAVVEAHDLSPAARPIVAASPHWRAAPVMALAGVGMMVIGVALYAAVANHRALSQAVKALSARRAGVTVVVQHALSEVEGPPSASGTMHSARWQLVPGGMGGGFGAAEHSEAY